MNTRMIRQHLSSLLPAALFILLAGLPSAAVRGQAADASYDGPSVLPTDITMGLEVFQFDYKEDFTPPNKSTERGPIPGIRVSTTSNRRYPFYVRLGLGYAAATETYDGSTQQGEPRISDTKSDFFDVAIIGNYRVVLDEGWTLTPHVGLTYRLWNRNVLGSGGIEEMYTWHSIPFGAGLEWMAGRTMSIGLDLEALVMVQGKIKIYFSKQDHGMPDAVLTLKNRIGFRATAPVRLALGEYWTLGVRPYFEAYSFGRSNPYIEHGDAMFLEPSSTTYRYGVVLQATLGW